MVDERKVPEGYKVTEVGILPGDWSCNSLRDFIYISSGESPSKFRFSNLGIPYFKVEQLNNTSKYQRETPYRILSDKYVPKGSIIFPKRGAAIFLNKIRILNQNSYMDTNLMTLTVNSDQLYNEFLFYLLDSKGLWRIADTTSVPQINNKHILPIIFQNPPLPEQKAIAEALSDTDNLIQSVEKLIDKKKKIKQGAMQQLLTGKKRLPGFSGDWEYQKVESFGEIVTGGTPPTGIKIYWNGNIPWVTPTDITSKKNIDATERMITDFGLSKLRKLPKNSVLITCIASIGKNAIIKNDGACNQQINAIIPNNNYDSVFLYYLFEISKSYLMSNAGITATNIISKKDFALLEFLVPKLNEQKAIAQVLSDMDAEIEALEEKLEKVKTIKQGMMQELLTGRIRLI